VLTRILHRMILWELVKVFSLSLIGITGILLMAGIIAEASQQGLGPMQILAIIPLLIPSTLPYTIPATTLFATCVVYGRLSADNEILAIRAAGINLTTVIWPGVLVGLVMSCLTMGLYYRIIPYTHHLMRSMFLKNPEELLYALLRKEQRIEQPRLDYALFVNRVEVRKLIDPIFKRRDKQGHFDAVAVAREAELQLHITPEKREILVHMRHGVLWTRGGGPSVWFDDKVWEVPLPGDAMKQGPLRPRDQTWQEMLGARRELLARAEKTDHEIAQGLARMLLQNVPKDLPQHVRNLKDRRRQIRFELLAIDTELYMRPALSFGCLCFVLVGCPVGIWLSRSDYLSAFITCFLPIVFLYYPLMLCGSNFAREGKFHPLATVWAANALMALIGAALFRKLLRN